MHNVATALTAGRNNVVTCLALRNALRSPASERSDGAQSHDFGGARAVRSIPSVVTAEIHTCSSASRSRSEPAGDYEGSTQRSWDGGF
jgi:hypothetical protein